MDRVVRAALDALLALDGGTRRRLMLRAHHARRRLVGGYPVSLDDPLLNALAALSPEQFRAVSTSLRGEVRERARRDAAVRKAAFRRRRAEYMREYRRNKVVNNS